MMSALPEDVVGRVTSEAAADLWARFVKVHDDHPGGIYVFLCDSRSFAQPVYDNWFESWEEACQFLDSLGEIEWNLPSGDSSSSGDHQ